MIKKIIQLLAISILLLVIFSITPVLFLYISPDADIVSNGDVAEKLSHNKGEDFQFIILGDNHAGLIFDDSATLKLIRRMNREGRFEKLPIDFVAISGDITCRGSRWDYKTYNKIRSLIKYPVLSAKGNHDDDKDKVFFDKYAGSSEFSFIDRNSYFIVLDNTEGDISEKQFSWLEGELKKSEIYINRFIIMHKSPISSYQQSWYKPELNPWSYRFMKLCEKYKVDMVFTGHEHMYKKQSFGGVIYLTSGGGGMLTEIPGPDGGFLHYLVIRVHGDYIDYEVRKVSPPLWEYFTYYLWKDLFYRLKDIAY